MTDLLLSLFHEKSAWELLAVFLGIAYLWLAIRENILCWPAAFVSTAIYIWLFWHVSLFMDSALNVYYMLMAGYGFWMWQSKSDAGQSASLSITTWNKQQHALAILVVLIASVVSGYLLENNTNAAWPYLDSFTTWGSVLTTYMVAKKKLENWVYWIVIDSVAIVLYIERGLYPTAMLFAVYLVMCVVGLIAWKKRYDNHRPASDTDNVISVT